MTTNAISFTRQYDNAIALVDRVKTLAVRNAQEFAIAEEALKTIRELEKELDLEYREHPVIIEAKRMQGIKSDLAALLEGARKGLKGGAMLRYEQAEEAKRQAEELRLQAEAQKLADAETARLVAEQKKLFDAAEKARKLAEKRGDAFAAQAAANFAAQVKREALEIKAAPVVVPTVVLKQNTPSVTRRMVQKWRIKTIDGRVYSKADFAKTIRLNPGELPGVPERFFVLNPTAISGVIDSLGANHGIPHVSWYEEST